MELLSTVVQSLLDLGAAIFVPIIIILAGLIVKMKLKDAISAGLTLGVAFTGMTMLINFMTGAITPAAEAMLKNVGISLPIIDGGWTTMSTISWSWPYAFLMFPLMILINIIMLVLKKTNTFMECLGENLYCSRCSCNYRKYSTSIFGCRNSNYI